MSNGELVVFRSQVIPEFQVAGFAPCHDSIT
jgi:hypothetical protein